MKNMVYIQSGGPTSVINSSLFGAYSEAIRHPEDIDHIYGSINGIEGLIDGKLFDLREESGEDIELLIQTPGAALGTTRRKLPQDINDPVYMDIVHNLQKFHIKYVLVNGGNDSMDTCHQLSEYFKGSDIQVLGVPKTVDNDLAGTDHCLGFPSAARAVVNDVASIAKDIEVYAKGRITLIEVMGRDAGWLPAASACVQEDLAPDLIYVPEMKFDLDRFLKDVKKIYDEKQRALVVITEALPVSKDETIKADSFGHAFYEGTAQVLASIVKEKLGINTRGIGLSLSVRADPYNITRVDREEAIAMSRFLLEAALRGETGKVGCIKRITDIPYASGFVLEDASKIANAVRHIPEEWIKGPGILDREAVRHYTAPLLEGNIEVQAEHGRIKFARLDKTKVEE
jgi:6-phosphofructokinase 1